MKLYLNFAVCFTCLCSTFASNVSSNEANFIRICFQSYESKNRSGCENVKNLNITLLPLLFVCKSETQKNMKYNIGIAHSSDFENRKLKILRNCFTKKNELIEIVLHTTRKSSQHHDYFAQEKLSCHIDSNAAVVKLSAFFLKGLCTHIFPKDLPRILSSAGMCIMNVSKEVERTTELENATIILRK